MVKKNNFKVVTLKNDRATNEFDVSSKYAFNVVTVLGGIPFTTDNKIQNAFKEALDITRGLSEFGSDLSVTPSTNLRISLNYFETVDSIDVLICEWTERIH